MDKVKAAKRIGQGVGIGAAAVLVVALGLGAYTVFSGAGSNTNASATSYTAPVSDSVAPPTQDMTEAQSIYDQQVAQAAAAAQAAADALAAQQAAAQTAAKKAAESVAPTGPIKCPAGSNAQQYDDNNNATACLPNICMNGIGGPGQPTNEQCLVFKP